MINLVLICYCNFGCEICNSRLKFLCRLAAPESVQFFQFDKDGNMYVFEPGAGCTGESKLVQPGEEMIFSNITENKQVLNPSLQVKTAVKCEKKVDNIRATCSQRSFHAPLSDGKLEKMAYKNFAEDTMKKVNWVVKMYNDWRVHRNSGEAKKFIYCDLDKKETISEGTLLLL